MKHVDVLGVAAARSCVSVLATDKEFALRQPATHHLCCRLLGGCDDNSIIYCL